MKRLLGAFVLVGVLLGAVAWFAPATLVDARIATRTDGEFRLAEAEGTVWRGRGTLMPRNGSWGIPFAWRLQPLSLATQIIDIELLDGPSGRVRLAPEQASFTGMRATVPPRALPGVERLGAGGEIDLRADGLTIATDRIEGGATVEWRHARIRLPGLAAVDLGNLTAELRARGNALAGPVTSRGGEVAVTGDLALAPQRIDATFRLQAGPGASRELRDALASLGPTEPGGAVVVRMQRELR